MRLIAILTLALLPGLGWAQGAPDRETLADIKQELQVLYVRLKELKRELSTTQSPGLQNTGGLLERMDALESSVQRLTGKTEELENRIDSVVADGTMQINDILFRVCEMEKGCDPANIDLDKTLGGGAVRQTAVTPASVAPPGNELAVGEQDDFDQALDAFNAQDYALASDMFADFNESYSGSPLAAAAHLYRGLSLDGMGETGDAARAYLDAFSVNPEGEEAPAALFQLGLSLNALGQTEQACVTLAEVGIRFPADLMVEKAENARSRIGCS